MAGIERHQLVSCSELAGIDEALAWVVGVYDQEFTGASMVKIAVEQVMRSTPDPDDPWRLVWTAAVSGSFDERTPDGQQPDTAAAPYT